MELLWQHSTRVGLRGDPVASPKRDPLIFTTIDKHQLVTTFLQIVMVVKDSEVYDIRQLSECVGTTKIKFLVSRCNQDFCNQLYWS